MLNCALQRTCLCDTGDALVYTFSPVLTVFNWLQNQKTVCSLWMFYKLLEGKKCILNTVEAWFTLKFFHCEKICFPLTVYRGNYKEVKINYDEVCWHFIMFSSWFISIWQLVWMNAFVMVNNMYSKNTETRCF